jgi:hypothetical protein
VVMLLKSLRTRAPWGVVRVAPYGIQLRRAGRRAHPRGW